jgi:hypothetical protein
MKVRLRYFHSTLLSAQRACIPTASLETNVAVLLKAGADPNLRNELGQNTMDIAVAMGKPREKIAQMLAEAGGKESKKEL